MYIKYFFPCFFFTPYSSSLKATVLIHSICNGDRHWLINRSQWKMYSDGLLFWNKPSKIWGLKFELLINEQNLTWGKLRKVSNDFVSIISKNNAHPFCISLKSNFSHLSNVPVTFPRNTKCFLYCFLDCSKKTFSMYDTRRAADIYIYIYIYILFKHVKRMNTIIS